MAGNQIWRLMVVATAFGAVLLAPPAWAGNRVALVIGVGQYRAVPSLANPARDAASVAQALRAVDFQVTELTNAAQLDRNGLSSALMAFRRAAMGAEAAVVYFAGHGVEVKGRNWLLPSDVHADSADDIEVTALPTSQFVNAVSGASTVRLVILDACRDNPFANTPGWSKDRSTSSSRGLAREGDLPPNVVVLLATQPGAKASDGQGTANSPFARALATSLMADGMRLYSLPSTISRQMRQTTGVDQRPDQQGIFDEPEWMFRSAAVARPVPPSVTQPVTGRVVNPTTNAVVLPPVSPPVSASVVGGIPADRYARWGLTATDFVQKDDSTLFNKAGGVARLSAMEAAGQAGDPVALTLAAMAYEDEFVAKDMNKARELYTAAANLGEVRAMYALGERYRMGVSVKQDWVEALRWYRKAAVLGHVRASTGVGFIYSHGNGMGVKLDGVEAIQWFRKAADQGDSTAMYWLGDLHEYGLGVAQNYAEARRWYEKAAATGDTSSSRALIRMGDKGR